MQGLTGVIDEAAAEAAAACAALGMSEGAFLDEDAVAAAAVEAYLGLPPGAAPRNLASDAAAANKRKAPSQNHGAKKVAKSTGAGSSSAGGGGAAKKPAQASNAKGKAKAGQPMSAAPSKASSTAPTKASAAAAAAARLAKERQEIEAWESSLKLLKDMRVPGRSLAELWGTLDEMVAGLLPQPPEVRARRPTARTPHDAQPGTHEYGPRTAPSPLSAARSPRGRPAPRPLPALHRSSA